jgi:hypothetical protein
MRRDQLLEQEVIFEQFNNQIPEQPPTAPTQVPGDAITGLISNTLVVGGKVGTQQNVETPQPIDPGASPNFASLSLSGNIVVGGSITGGPLSVSLNHASNPVINVNQLGAGLLQKWQKSGVDIASLSALGKLLLPAGIGSTPSTDTISNFGTYFVDYISRQNPANLLETDFSAKTTSANIFANDGDYMVFFIGIFFPTSINQKRWRLYFGGQVIADTGMQVFSNVFHSVLGILSRNSNSTLQSTFMFTPGFLPIPQTQISSVNFATSNILKTTGQQVNGTPASGQLSQSPLVFLKGSV